MSNSKHLTPFEQTAEEIRQRYAQSAQNKYFNAIIYGHSGTGKTFSLKTLPQPMLIHSFDPGGTKSISPEIQKGNILVDNSFEIEDPSKPSAFKRWDTEYHKLKRANFFDNIETYVIDSLTTWANCALNEIMARSGRAGGTPQQNDWLPQMNLLENALRDFLTLPCNVILTAHATVDKDEISGKMYSSLMVTGKLRQRIPLLFDEMYYAFSKSTSKGTEYLFQTRSSSNITARSRLSNANQLEMYEPMDFKKILKKVS